MEKSKTTLFVILLIFTVCFGLAALICLLGAIVGFNVQIGDVILGGENRLQDLGEAIGFAVVANVCFFLIPLLCKTK